MNPKTPLKIKIIIDADACPVKELIERAATRHGVPVEMVTATAMRDRPTPGVEIIRIPSGPDAVDDWIIEHCGPGDIVITQDIPLAASCIQLGAMVIENRGEVLDAGNIGVRLAMRNFSMGLREAGVLDEGCGPRPMTQRDRNRFAQALGRLLDQVRQG